MVLVFPLAIYASNKNTIQGKITDTKGVPIPFAAIGIEETPFGTTTNQKGEFNLSVKFSGKGSLIIKCLGYKEKKIKIDFSKSSILHVNEKLEEDVVNLQNVNVVAESKSKILERQGFAVRSIDLKQLDMKSIELNGVLNQTAGVKIRQDGGLGAHTSISVNGLSGNAVRIFIDGMPMEYYGSSYSLNSLPVSLIERVDVYKGLVPIELGNDALGGAINIITKKKKKNTLSASYSYGSFNTHRATLDASVRDEKTGLTGKFSTFYNYSDNNYKVWSDDVILIDDGRRPDGSIDYDRLGTIKRGVKTRRFHDAYESYGAKVEVGIGGKSWADELLIGINASKMEKDIQHGATMMIPYGERRANSEMYSPSLTYRKKNLLPGLDVNTTFRYTHSERQLIDTSMNTYNWLGDKVILPNQTRGEGGSASLNTNTNKTYLGRINGTQKINENLNLGVNYIYSDYNRSSDDPLSNPDVRLYGTENIIKKQILGLTIQNHMLDERMTNSLFLKYYGNDVSIKKAIYNSDKNEVVPYSYSKFDSNIGYGATSVFEILPNARLSLSYEKAIRLPGPNEVFGNVADDIVEANNLKPEKSHNINIGTILGPFQAGEHRFNVSSNFFYRNVTDKLKRVLGERGNEKDLYVYKNLGKTLIKGVDAKFEYSYDTRFNAAVYGSYLDSRFREKYDEYGNKHLHYNAREMNTPYLTGGASINYHLEHFILPGSKMSFTWSSSYVHDFYLKWETYGSQGKAVIPTQFINDCGVAYTFPSRKMTWSIDARNVFNRLAFDNYAIQKPGRAIYTKITFQL